MVVRCFTTLDQTRLLQCHKEVVFNGIGGVLLHGKAIVIPSQIVELQQNVTTMTSKYDGIDLNFVVCLT